jgi:peptide deformylase
MPTFLEPLIMGNPILLEKSLEVDNISSLEVQECIENMLYTVQTIGERVGLAAPQVGILKRIVVFRIPAKPVNLRYAAISDPDQVEIPWTVFINPVITPLSNAITAGWEGCISVPGMVGKVDRFDHIKYTYFDEKGEFHEREAKGFHARVMQHEFDHLDGVLFPMRVKNMRDFGFESEIMKIIT